MRLTCSNCITTITLIKIWWFEIFVPLLLEAHSAAPASMWSQISSAISVYPWLLTIASGPPSRCCCTSSTNWCWTVSLACALADCSRCWRSRWCRPRIVLSWVFAFPIFPASARSLPEALKLLKHLMSPPTAKTLQLLTPHATPKPHHCLEGTQFPHSLSWLADPVAAFRNSLTSWSNISIASSATRYSLFACNRLANPISLSRSSQPAEIAPLVICNFPLVMQFVLVALLPLFHFIKECLLASILPL